MRSRLEVRRLQAQVQKLQAAKATCKKREARRRALHIAYAAGAATVHELARRFGGNSEDARRQIRRTVGFVSNGL